MVDFSKTDTNPLADLSKRFDMTLAAVSYAVKRGEKIAKETGWHLDE